MIQKIELIDPEISEVIDALKLVDAGGSNSICVLTEDGGVGILVIEDTPVTPSIRIEPIKGLDGS